MTQDVVNPFAEFLDEDTAAEGEAVPNAEPIYSTAPVTFDADPDIAGLQLEHQVNTSNDRDASRDHSALTAFKRLFPIAETATNVAKSFQPLDDKGVTDWITGEKAAAADSESFWSGVGSTVKQLRASHPMLGEAGLKLPGIAPGAAKILSWAERQANERVAKAKRRLHMALDMEEGKRPGPKYGTGTSMVMDTLNALGSGWANTVQGAGRLNEIIADSAYGLSDEDHKRLAFGEGGFANYQEAKDGVVGELKTAWKMAMERDGALSGKAIELALRGASAFQDAAGDWMLEKSRELFPVDQARQEEFRSKLAHGIGSMLSFLGPSMASSVLAKASNKTLLRVFEEAPDEIIRKMAAEKLEDASKKAAQATSGTLGAGMTAESEAQQAELAGADKATARNVFLLNLPLGATEAAPIGHLFETPSGRWFTSAFGQGAEEFTQEFGQSVGANVVAQMTYDPDRTWDNDAWDNAFIGFILGHGSESARRAYQAARQGGTLKDAVPETAEERAAAFGAAGDAVSAEARQNASEGQEPPSGGPPPAATGKSMLKEGAAALRQPTEVSIITDKEFQELQGKPQELKGRQTLGGREGYLGVGEKMAAMTQAPADAAPEAQAEPAADADLKADFEAMLPKQTSGASEDDGRLAEIEERYVGEALANLQATSRTAKGVVDTSASPEKAGKIAEGLTGEQAAQTATANVEKVARQLYQRRDQLPADTADAQEFIDQVAADVNAGILKEGALMRTDDSDKYAYTRVENLNQAHAQFAEELVQRLNDPQADPVETAAWIEWRTNLTDHFWADGVGKTSKLLAALPLMRAGLPLPSYGPNTKAFYAFAPKQPIVPDATGQAYLGPEYQAFVEHYRKLMKKGGKADGQDLKRRFVAILAGKTPRSQWAKQLLVDDKAMQALEKWAIEGQLLRVSPTGQVRRTGKAKLDGQVASSKEEAQGAGAVRAPAAAAAQSAVPGERGAVDRRSASGVPAAFGSRDSAKDRRRGVLKTYKASKAAAAHYKKAGASVFDMEELAPERAEDFRNAIAAARDANPNGASVQVKDVAEYAVARLFLSKDGTAGFAIQDGNELVSVFKHPASPHKRAAMLMLDLAIQEGARRLDAFDTELPKIYGAAGFRAVARIKFNREYAPPGWDYAHFAAYNNGEPDPVFMVYEPGYGPYQRGDGRLFPDYDSASNYAKAVAAGDLSLLDREIAAREIMATPEYQGAEARHGADTTQQAGYGTPEWKAKRQYIAKDGSTINGWDAAVAHQIAKAKSEVKGGIRAEKQAYLVIGLPAAGKSTLAETMRDQFGAAIVDGDDFKVMIPEYGDGWNSSGVHEEASALSKDMLSQMLREGDNLIIPKLGSSDASISKPAAALRAKGYKVHLVYVEVPKAVAMERAIKRWRSTGRTVPVSIYDQINVGDVYGALKTSGAADTASRIVWREPTGWEPADDTHAIRGLRFRVEGQVPGNRPQGQPALGGPNLDPRSDRGYRGSVGLALTSEDRIAGLVRAREAKTKRRLKPVVVDYALRLDELRGSPEFDLVYAEVKADKSVLKEDMHDLAALAGNEVPKSATKAAALKSIAQRHTALVTQAMQQQNQVAAASFANLFKAYNIHSRDAIRKGSPLWPLRHGIAAGMLGNIGMAYASGGALAAGGVAAANVPAAYALVQGHLREIKRVYDKLEDMELMQRSDELASFANTVLDADDVIGGEFEISYPYGVPIEQLEDEGGEAASHPDKEIIAWHGSAGLLGEKFDPSNADEKDNFGVHFGTYDQAFRFFESAPSADDDISGHGEPVMVPVLLDMKNVLTLEDRGTVWETWDILAQIDEQDHDLANRLEARVKEGKVRKQPTVDGGSYEVAVEAYSPELLREALIAEGVDGLRYRNEVEGTGWSYIAFKPGTVRSAIHANIPLMSFADIAPAELGAQAGTILDFNPELDNSEEARRARAEALGFDFDTPYYHGTGSVFEAFDRQHLGKNFDFGGTGQGFFFTTKRPMAERFATGRAPHVIDARLRLENPLVINVDESLRREVARVTKEKGLVEGTLRKVVTSLSSKLALFEPEFDRMAEMARRGGHDAVVVDFGPRSSMGKLVIVPDPTQIRDHRASFSLANADSPLLLAQFAGPDPSLDAIKAAASKLRWSVLSNAMRNWFGATEEAETETEVPAAAKPPITQDQFGERQLLDMLPILEKQPQRLAPAMRDVAVRLEAELKKALPKDVVVRIMDKLSTNGREAVGVTDAAARLLKVSLAFGEGQARATGRHEIIHMLRELGLFTEEEWGLLTDRAWRIFGEDRNATITLATGTVVTAQDWIADYRAHYSAVLFNAGMRGVALETRLNEILDQELVAKLAEGYEQGNRYGAGIDGLIKRILEFFDAVMNAWRGARLASPDAVLRRAFAGEMAARAATESALARRAANARLPAGLQQLLDEAEAMTLPVPFPVRQGANFHFQKQPEFELPAFAELQPSGVWAVKTTSGTLAHGADGHPMGFSTEADAKAYIARRPFIDHNESFIQSMLDDAYMTFEKAYPLASFAAYHGTPHDWQPEKKLRLKDGREVFVGINENVPEGAMVLKEYPAGRVDLSKISTGEGSDVYGPGFYAAQNYNVAKSYRQNLSMRSAAMKAAENGKLAEFEAELKEERKRVEAMQGYGRLGPLRQLEFDEADLARVKALPPEQINSKGSLYTLNINVGDDAILDWDLSIGGQHPRVKKALKDAGFISPAPLEWLKANIGVEGTPEKGADIIAAGNIKNPTGLRKTLVDHGIKVIRYLDGQSRDQGAGTFNYVILDESAVDVVEKNGVPVNAETKSAMLAKTRSDALAASPLAAKLLQDGKSLENAVDLARVAVLETENTNQHVEAMKALAALTRMQSLELASFAGLDPSPEARRQRAIDAGFDYDNPVYHGTKHAFDAFDPTHKKRFQAINPIDAIFVTPSYEFAEEFAKRAGWISGGEVMELVIRKDIKLFDPKNNPQDYATARDFLIRNEIAVMDTEGFDYYPKLENLIRELRGDDNWMIVEHPLLQNWLRENGYDGFKAVGKWEDDEASREITALYNPSHLRSPNAMFAADKLNDAFLLASFANPEAPLDRLAAQLAYGPTSTDRGSEVPATVKPLNQLIADLKDALNMTATQGRYGLTVTDRSSGPENNRPEKDWHFKPQPHVRGQYDTRSGVARFAVSTDIAAIAHEGGHHLERLFGQSLRSIMENDRRELLRYAARNATPAAPERPMPALPATGYTGIDLDSDTQQLLIEAAAADRSRQVAENAGLAPGRVDEVVSHRASVTRAELAHRLGGTIADGLIEMVASESIPATQVAYVRERFSATGTPRAPVNDMRTSLSEGFAEFFNEYVTNPAKAQRYAPHFYQAFEEFLDVEGPQLLEKIERLQIVTTSQEYEEYLRSTTLDRATADLVSNADQSLTKQGKDMLEMMGQKDTVSGFAAHVYTSAIDEANPVYQVTKNLLLQGDENGLVDDEGRAITLAVHENPYKLLRSIGDAFKTGLRWIQDGMPNYRTAEGQRSSSLHAALNAVMGKSGWNLATYQKFGVYLESRRAIEEWKLWDAKRQEMANLEQRAVTAREQLTQLRALRRKEADLDRSQQLDLAIAKREQALTSARERLNELRSKGLQRNPHRVSQAEHELRIKQLEAENANMRPAAEMVYDFLWQQAVHDFQAGRLTQEELDYRATRRHFYVPFARDLSDIIQERGFGGRSTGARFSKDKAFKGSDRAIINPIESILDQTFHRAAATHFNDVVKSLANLADMVGPGGNAIAERVSKESFLAATADGFKQLEGHLVSLGYDLEDARDMVKRVESDFGDTTLLLTWSPESFGAARPLLIPLWENGERNYLRINDVEFAAQMAQTLNGVGREMSNLIMDWAAAPAQWLRMGITSNPTFVIPNIIRDMTSSWIITGSVMDPRTWPLITQARGLYHEMRQTDLARLYQEVAGIMGGQNVSALSKVRDKMDVMQLKDRGLRVKPLRLLTASTIGAAAGFTVMGPVGALFGTFLGAGLHRAGKSGLNFMETMSLFSDMSETATRLGTFTQSYKTALAYNPGITPYQAAQEAAYVARDLIDFGRRGSRMLTVSRLVPFLNANIQGLDKTFRTLTAKGDRGSNVSFSKLAAVSGAAAVTGAVAGPIAGVVAAVAAPAVAVQMASRSELVRRILKPLFDQRPAGIPLSRDDEMALGNAAKAWMNLIVYSAILLAFRWLYDDDDEYQMINPKVKNRSQPVKLGGEWFQIPKAFEWSVPGTIIEAAIDAQVEKDPRLKERILDALYNNAPPLPVPQSISLWSDIRANYNSRTERAIVPDYLKELPPQEQYNAYTSQLALGMARYINESPALKTAAEATGNVVFAKQNFELSPMVIDYAISTGFGYWGKDIQKASNFASDVGPASGRATEFPILGTMLGRISIDPYQASDARELFWKKMAKTSGDTLPRSAAGYDSILKSKGQTAANHYLATLDDQHRSYALLMAQGDTNLRRLHPMNRMESIYDATSDIRKEIIGGNLVDTSTDELKPIVLAPAVAKEVLDAIGQYEGIEMTNTMVAVKDGQFANRKPIDPTPILEVLKAASPEAYEELQTRMVRKNVEGYADTLSEWPTIAKMLTEEWEESMRTGNEALPNPKPRRMNLGGPLPDPHGGRFSDVPDGPQFPGEFDPRVVRDPGFEVDPYAGNPNSVPPRSRVVDPGDVHDLQQERPTLH